MSEDITVPSMLDQYTSLYNKNGRIGIYTKKERIEIIERFREKRRRRVWKKKIRYHCRKNLADKRIRIKGRFVKKIEDTPDAENENELSSTEEGMDEEMDESPITVKDESSLLSSGGQAELPTMNCPGTTQTESGSSSTSSSSDAPGMQGRDSGNMQRGVEEGYERMRRHSIAY